MSTPKFSVGDTVYIRKGEKGSWNKVYNSTTNSPNTKIISVELKGAYVYSVACSAQTWKEESLSLVNYPVIQHLKDYERMYDDDFGTVLKLPTGYVFSRPATFVPIITTKEKL